MVLDSGDSRRLILLTDTIQPSRSEKIQQLPTAAVIPEVVDQDPSPQQVAEVEDHVDCEEPEAAAQ